MKKYLVPVSAVVIVGALIVVGFLLAPKKGTAPEIVPPVSEKKVEKRKTEDLIRVAKPVSGAEITSPLTITGEARGTWFFEASFPVRLLDENGKELALSVATAEGEWMTDEFVPFSATLIFDAQGAKSGKIILEKDNPSDMRELDASIEVPVRFSQAETMTVKVFFPNRDSETEMDCTVTGPRERTIVKTQAVARAALEQLLAGPTWEEKRQGDFTSINEGVKINSLNLRNSTAFVDFDQQLEKAVGGSCRVASIRSQIEETLRQFPTIKAVVISIDGRTGDVLQP